MNTELLKNVNERSMLSIVEVSRVTGLSVAAVAKRLQRGTFLEPDTHSHGIIRGEDGRTARLYWSPRTIKEFLKTLKK